MAASAKNAGHKLVIKSATRNFDNQKMIWEKKWDGTTILEDKTKASNIKDPVVRSKKILLYSSMPGTSRHHWGTDIDLNALENVYFEKGKGKRLYEWMTIHAHEYGFCQVYNTKSTRPNGYNEEKWHWSYMPIASQIMAIAKSQLNNSMINGFKGAETAIEIDMVNNYILSINTDCN
jgi:zinc D-Ala-D-Ala carboxypeptidase